MLDLPGGDTARRPQAAGREHPAGLPDPKGGQARGEEKAVQGVAPQTPYGGAIR